MNGLKGTARRISAALIASALAFSAIPAFARELTAENGAVSAGSDGATIVIQGNDGQTLNGKKFKVYRLFNEENGAGGESVNYTWNEEYKTAIQNAVAPKLEPAETNPADVTEYEAIDYIQTLNTRKADGALQKQENEGRYSDFRVFVETLRDEVKKLGDVGDTVTVTDADGKNKVTISGLPYGWYLIDEVTGVAGQDAAASLCMVNTANPDMSVEIKSDYPSVTKKILEDDDAETIGDGGYNDIGDYETGQTVPYKFTSEIPDINGYDTYLYKWHDRMDSALTFNSDSVKIHISDNGGTEYDLTSGEFTVTSPAGDETFTVEVADIKKIIDEHFNKIDEKKENTYGQTVTLSYTATLNETAAGNAGRAGFENDVRLEFSNDPDGDGKGKTGFTPWDTVVCFTFGLNIIKANQNGVKLAGARFRLYRDGDCTDEVYLKKADGGYTVISGDTAGDDEPGDAVEAESDENGSIVINGLDSDTYYLKETKAPAGYRRINDPIKITIDAEYSDNRNGYAKGDGAAGKALTGLSGTAHAKTFLNGLFGEGDLTVTADAETGALSFTVVNNTGSKLPATGSALMIILPLAGAGLVILAVKAGKRGRGKEKK